MVRHKNFLYLSFLTSSYRQNVGEENWVLGESLEDSVLVTLEVSLLQSFVVI